MKGSAMRLLILGGTWFLGRTLAEQALALGWEVTCFNRGRTGRDVPGALSIRGDRTDREDVRRLASAGAGVNRWDAAIDTSVYEPADLLMTAQALQPVADRYVLVSTVSAYRDWPQKAVDESSALWPSRMDACETDPDIRSMPVPVAYGTLKAGCELALDSVFGSSALILRPGVVLGPHEYVGRLPVLLGRARRGGAILAADDRDRPIQPVDVRDLSSFIMQRLVGGMSSDFRRDGNARVFNVTAPRGHATYEGLLNACVDVTGADVEFVWADPEWLELQGVKQWTQLPLWRRAPGTWNVDSTSALASGLTARPLRETISDTWAWLQQEDPIPHDRQTEHGLPSTREAELVRAWRTR